ncbi:hypothetical protein AVEN_101973-1 [Araneus ventricosus]|uniref:Transposase Tc1-like domain-containing protein n=1 Tax=Araneus ventricosus TaxID=182803 RepID=A0A4Y2S8H2_ARAVE|nr:hypothetical protein AVEN_101973-1 [Araneus ventricosus]
MESSVSLHFPVVSALWGETQKHQGLATPWAGDVVTNSGTILAADEIIRKNRRITTREIAVELSIRKGTAHRIIHKKLGYGKICAHWVSKHLSENQKIARGGLDTSATQEFLH